MRRDDLNLILAQHRRWLDTGGRAGKRADLTGADLRGANLYHADLDDADLYGASLNGAYLTGAYLNGANLAGANLTGATLNGTNLKDASLAGVRTNWFTRMTTRGALNLTAEQRRLLGMQPRPRAMNARHANDLARRLTR
jgi:uncharacterized protein YjbI with pentapeptide repeats